MFEFLDKIRSKPIMVRQVIAFWASVGLTLLVASFWLVGLTTSLEINPARNVASVESTDVVERVKNFFNNSSEYSAYEQDIR